MSNRNELIRICIYSRVLLFVSIMHTTVTMQLLCQTIRGSYPGNFKLRVYTTPLQLI